MWIPVSIRTVTRSQDSVLVSSHTYLLHPSTPPMLAPPITRVPLSLDKGFFAQRGPFLLHWRIFGGAMRSRAMQDTRQLFLWSMGVVFLFAFTSLFVQIPGRAQFQFH